MLQTEHCTQVTVVLCVLLTSFTLKQTPQSFVSSDERTFRQICSWLMVSLEIVDVLNFFFLVEKKRGCTGWLLLGGIFRFAGSCGTVSLQCSYECNGCCDVLLTRLKGTYLIAV